MKKLIALLFTAFFGVFIAAAAGFNPLLGAGATLTLSVASSFVSPQINGALFTTPDLSAITYAFVEFGGEIFRKHVNSWMIDGGITVMRNVKKPQVLPKLSALGGPRPYSAADNTSGNGVKFSDRTLTVKQSKWDYDIDPQIFRNTYLANNDDVPFYQFILSQVATEYLGQLNDKSIFFGQDVADFVAFDNGAAYAVGDQVIFNGDYYQANAITVAGESPATTPAKWDLRNVEAIAIGWKKIIEDEITATNLTPIVTGVISAANAVTKFEQMIEEAPSWMKEKSVIIYCSWSNFENYKKHYRTLNGFGFQKRENGEFYIDGYRDVKIRPATWLGASGRLILTLPGNLIVGTDGDSIELAPSIRRNIIEVRQMMPVGYEIADLEALVVNDQE